MADGWSWRSIDDFFSDLSAAETEEVARRNPYYGRNAPLPPPTEREIRDDAIRADSADGMTNNALAKKYDMSPQRVSQIVRRANK